MKQGKPFITEVDETKIENHICTDSADTDCSFEFLQSSIWDEKFFNPDSSTDSATAALCFQLGEIKQLIQDIKTILSDIFETKTKDLDI